VQFFRRKKKQSLSELQGVPFGTFRCDVCRFVLPAICLCGAVVDAADKPTKTYTLCGICSVWLGFKETRFPQGLCFNFTEKQRDKIRNLHKQLGIASKDLAFFSTTNANLRAPNEIGEFLQLTPDLRELIRLRFSLLREDIIDLSRRLTIGEFVDSSEIKKANGQ
jgi:hypothetical protein